MKKYLFLIATIILALNSCQQAPEKVTVDVEAEKAAVNNLIQTILDGITIDKNIGIMDSLLTADCDTYGSDPEEHWNKEDLINMWTETIKGQMPTMELIGNRVVKIGPDGKSAIVVEQYNYSAFAPRIPKRNVYYAVKDDGIWKISFMSTSLIPENEYLSVMNGAVRDAQSKE